MTCLKRLLCSCLLLLAGCGLLPESTETAPDVASETATSISDSEMTESENAVSMTAEPSLKESTSPSASKNRSKRPKPPRGRTSVEGRPLDYSTHGYGAETIMILGGIHGNEPASAVLVEKLAANLNVHPLLLKGKRVVTSPLLNPDGLERNTRGNANRIDLNRNFATRNRKSGKRSGYEPLSEPEAVFIADLIAYYKPVRILSVHQPLKCVDWDGPGKELARALSETSGLPMKKLGSLPGSLGSYAGIELGIPIITLELPRRVEERGEDFIWEKYGETMLRFIQFSDEKKGDAGQPDSGDQQEPNAQKESEAKNESGKRALG